MSDDIISTVNYKESNPIYQKIKKLFIEKLKDKYQCDDYDSIADFVFQHAFKKKLKKSDCVQKMDFIFNNKSELMIDYLWEITRKVENPQEESYSDSDNTNNYIKESRKNDSKKNYKRKRERSRSYSRERTRNTFDFENFSNYPPIIPKGFYPPKGRSEKTIVPFRGAYPPYMMIPPSIPSIMKR